MTRGAGRESRRPDSRAASRRCTRRLAGVLSFAEPRAAGYLDLAGCATRTATISGCSPGISSCLPQRELLRVTASTWLCHRKRPPRRAPEIVAVLVAQPAKIEIGRLPGVLRKKELLQAAGASSGCSARVRTSGFSSSSSGSWPSRRFQAGENQCRPAAKFRSNAPSRPWPDSPSRRSSLSRAASSNSLRSEMSMCTPTTRSISPLEPSS